MNEIRCVCCGRFIPYREIDDGKASFYFEPDSHKGPEISEWSHNVCRTAAHLHEER